MQVQVRRTKREKTLGASKVIYFLKMALLITTTIQPKSMFYKGREFLVKGEPKIPDSW